MHLLTTKQQHFYVPHSKYHHRFTTQTQTDHMKKHPVSCILNIYETHKAPVGFFPFAYSVTPHSNKSISCVLHTVKPLFNELLGD
jgi:hypothetical protein